jgi:hypothetical protein
VRVGCRNFSYKSRLMAQKGLVEWPRVDIRTTLYRLIYVYRSGNPDNNLESQYLCSHVFGGLSVVKLLSDFPEGNINYSLNKAGNNLTITISKLECFLETSCALNKLQGAEPLRGQQFLTHFQKS